MASAEKSRLGFRVGPQPLGLPPEQRGDIPRCDAGCMVYSDGWDHWHTCAFAAWYLKRERAVSELDQLEGELTRYAKINLGDRLRSIEADVAQLGGYCNRTGELLAIIRSMMIERAWRPIESAPKDGTQVLVWCSGFGSRVALWWADAEEWLIAGTDTVCRPTHWQPLLRGP